MRGLFQEDFHIRGLFQEEFHSGDCGMGLLSSGMLSLTQLRVVSPSWQKVQ